MTEAERLVEQIAAELAEPNYNRDTRTIAYLIDRLISERLAEQKRRPKAKAAA
jgi:hypothetical protein